MVSVHCCLNRRTRQIAAKSSVKERKDSPEVKITDLTCVIIFISKYKKLGRGRVFTNQCGSFSIVAVGGGYLLLLQFLLLFSGYKEGSNAKQYVVYLNKTL